jgi:hypothetical protein
MTEVICGFTQPLQENFRIVPEIGEDHIFSHPIQFIIHYHPIIQRYMVELLTVLLNKLDSS